MKFWTNFLGLITIFISGFCYGAEPTEPLAVVLGPERVEIGRSAWLKTTGSKGKGFQWKIVPPAASKYFTELPIYGGMDAGPDNKLGTADDFPLIHRWAHFDSNVEGTYYFILIVTKDNKSSVAIHKLVNGKGLPTPTPNPNPDPDPPIPDISIAKPEEPYLGFVKPITPLITGKDASVIKRDSIELAKFYLDFADVLERDENIIKTTGHILKLNQNAGQLMFQKTGMKGKYDNLPSAIDTAFAEALTLEDVSLTASKRDKAVKVSKAIAWACLEAGKK